MKRNQHYQQLWKSVTRGKTNEELAWAIDEPCFYRFLELCETIAGDILIVGGWPGIDAAALESTRLWAVDILEREGAYLEQTRAARRDKVFSDWQEIPVDRYKLIFVDGPTEERAGDFVKAWGLIERGDIIALHDTNRSIEDGILQVFLMSNPVESVFFKEGRGLAWVIKP